MVGPKIKMSFPSFRFLFPRRRGEIHDVTTIQAPPQSQGPWCQNRHFLVGQELLLVFDTDACDLSSRSEGHNTFEDSDGKVEENGSSSQRA